MIEKLENASFEQLENEINDVINKLQNDKLPLDEAGKLYEYGKKITSLMNSKLEELSKKVEHKIESENDNND